MSSGAYYGGVYSTLWEHVLYGVLPLWSIVYYHILYYTINPVQRLLDLVRSVRPMAVYNGAMWT